MPTRRKKTGLLFFAAKPSTPHRNIPGTAIYVCPTPAVAEQSGDRQRREKGLPILTAEKGEHERAPSVGEIYLSSLRATLRAPPPKWAIKAFFPECRAAGFLWYFLSLRKKVLPSSGRQPHRPRRSRRVKPPQPSWRIALLAVGFPLPPEHRKSVSTTMVWQVPSVPGRVAIHRCLHTRPSTGCAYRKK